MGQRGPQPGRPEMPLRKDAERQRVFLDALRETGNLRESARRASPHSEAGCMSSFKSFARDDASFAAKIGEALDDFRESLVKAAVTRGRDGVPRPIYQKGQLVGFEQQYSDNLLLAELRKHYPREYAQKYDVQHQHRVAIEPAGAWSISTDDLACLSQDQRDSLREIMVTIRAARREHQAIEHQPAETIDAEFEEVDDEWHSPTEPIPF